MASIVLDITLPGAGSALNLLHAISKSCNEIQEGRPGFHHVGGRLHEILRELNKLQEANQLPPNDALYEYGAMLRNYLAYLQQCHDRPAWFRASYSKVMMDELKVMHEQIDGLLLPLKLVNVRVLTDWKYQWEMDNASHQRTLQASAVGHDPAEVSRLLHQTENVSRPAPGYAPEARIGVPCDGNLISTPAVTQSTMPLRATVVNHPGGHPVSTDPTPLPSQHQAKQTLTMAASTVTNNKVQPIDESAPVAAASSTQNLVQVSATGSRNRLCKVAVVVVFVIVAAVVGLSFVLSRRSGATPTPAAAPTATPAAKPTTASPTVTPTAKPPTSAPTPAPTPPSVSTLSFGDSKSHISSAVAASDGWLYISDRFAIYRAMADDLPSTLTAIAGAPNSPGTRNGAAADARFKDLFGLTLDPTGTVLFISDAGGFKIRRLNLVTMVVVDVAGSGTSGNKDGPALSATFTSLYGLALDPAGNLYIADRESKLRKLTTRQGTVATLVGLTDRFVSAVAVSPAGGTYFASDNAIHLLSSDDKTQQIIAGNHDDSGTIDGQGTNARFCGIDSIAFSPSGADMYIADYYNHCIRKLNMQSKIVTTVAGTCGVGGYRDGAPANSLFTHPTGITVSSTGVLFVTEYFDNRFRRIYLGQ